MAGAARGVHARASAVLCAPSQHVRRSPSPVCSASHRLSSSHVIHNAANRTAPFVDDESFWRFQHDEEGALNCKRMQIWDNDQGACALVESLLRKLLRLVKRVVHIKTGSFAPQDLDALASTKEFERFELETADLQRVRPCPASVCVR